MSNFAVTFETEGDISLLSLQGELDAHTAEEFEAALLHVINQGSNRIVISGEQLSYISSVGLGVLMAHIDIIRTAGGDLKVAQLQPAVAKVFDLLGFQLLFEIYESKEEALRSFQSKGV